MTWRNTLRTAVTIFMPAVFACTSLAGLSGPALPAAASLTGHPTEPDFSQAAPPSNDFAAQEAALKQAVNREPENAVYLARLGSLLATENKLQEATPYFERALKVNPTDVETRRSLATSYWQLGRIAEAQSHLESVLKAAPNDALATLLLGMVSEDAGDPRRAAQLLGSVLPLVRKRPETISALARAYYQIGDRQKAQETLRMLIGHPAGAGAVFRGGQLAAESKDYETAEKMFRAVQTTYPDPVAVNYSLALAQFSGGRYAEAQKTLLAIMASAKPTADEYALLGWAYQKQDRLPEMLKAFEQAINMQPANQTFYIDLGDALAEKKNYPTAIEVAKEAVKRFPSSSAVYAMKGSVELKMYLLTEALKSYSKAAELDSNNSRAALGLALTQWNMDRDVEAAKSFEEGTRKFPQDGFFLLKHALFLLNAPGERDTNQEAKIKALLKRSEELDPSLAETHFQLGTLAMNENRYEEAMSELQLAAKLDPEMSKTHLALSRVYRRTGRAEEANRETEIHRKLRAGEEQKGEASAAVGTRHP